MLFIFFLSDNHDSPSGVPGQGMAYPPHWGFSPFVGQVICPSSKTRVSTTNTSLPPIGASADGQVHGHIVLFVSGALRDLIKCGLHDYRHLSCPSYCERNAPPIFGVVSRSMMNCSTTIGTLPPLFPSLRPASRKCRRILRRRGGGTGHILSERSSAHTPP